MHMPRTKWNNCRVLSIFSGRGILLLHINEHLLPRNVYYHNLPHNLWQLVILHKAETIHDDDEDYNISFCAMSIKSIKIILDQKCLRLKHEMFTGGNQERFLGERPSKLAHLDLHFW